MAKNASNEISCLVYDNEGPPRYYFIRRNWIKRIIFATSAITLISLLVSLGLVVYFKEIRQMIIKKEPMIIGELKNKNKDLNNQIVELNELTEQLQQKLVASPVGAKEAAKGLTPYLSLFMPVPGQQDLSHTPPIDLENFAAKKVNDQTLELTFNIINKTKNNRKIAGHLFVLLRHKKGLLLYPESNWPVADLQLPFTQGERFAATRFRPVKAEFSWAESADNLMFQILIFSRTGDLIHKKLFVPEGN